MTWRATLRQKDSCLCPALSHVKGAGIHVEATAFTLIGACRQIEMMEHAYSLHGHTRSMSSLASTIIPLPSERSPMTPITVPSLEPEYPTCHHTTPIELEIPLPPSRASSIYEGAEEQVETSKVNRPVLTENGAWEQGLPKYDRGQDDEINFMDAPMDFHTDMADTPSVSLDDLGRLFEVEQYVSRHAQSVRSDLDQLFRSATMSRRLIHTSSLAYCNLINHFRSNDHGGFAGAYQACEEVVDDCTQAGGLPPQAQSESGGGDKWEIQDLEGQPRSWIQKLPAANQEDIVEFISMIRTDRTFLSDCISRLSSSDFHALTSSYQFSGSGDSVLQNYIRTQSRNHGKDRAAGKLTPGIETLREFHQKDVIFALLHGVFDDSAKQGSQEYLLRTDVWSKACARLLIAGKQGSEDFVVTMLDAFSRFQEWKLKPKMEMYLMKLLSEGAFLLDPPPPADFKQPIEIQNAQAVIAISNFFDKALQELFLLLADGQPQICVPDSALDFAHAILSQIQDPKIRLQARMSIATRWYFSSFISNIIIHPESQGIMMTHHIGDSARQKIFKDLSIRLQKQVADVTSPWNHLTIVTPDAQSRVGHILALFEPRLSEGTAHPVRPYEKAARPGCLMLSAATIICLINFFFPDFFSPSVDFPYRTNPSTASSFAGSSTLTGGSADPESTAASSLAPSVSGTFATISTVVSEPSPEDVQAKDKQNPSSNLEGFCLKQTNSSSVNLGHRMRIICRKLEESSASEVEPVQTHFTDDWAFIYIAPAGKKLYTSINDTNSNLWRPTTPICQVSPSGGILGDDLESLHIAISRLTAGGDNLRYLIDDVRSNVENCHDPGSVLKSLFESAMSQCQAQFDFANALFWWKKIHLLEKISSLTQTYLPKIIGAIAKALESNINELTQTAERNQIWLRSLASLQKIQERELQKLEDTRRALRIKMWYVSDVRHSAPYEDALYVTRALRTMASSSRSKQPGSLAHWARHRLRNSLWQDRSESQTLEALAAHKDHGGLSKLADEQVELTIRWLTRNSIENFCKGEERIHRFCFEVQKCVNKLAGLNLLDSPVLWSSRLFGREKSAFDARHLMLRTYDSPKSPNTTAPTSIHGGGPMPPKVPYSSIPPPSDPYNLKSSNNTSHFSRVWNLPKESFEFNSKTLPLKSSFSHQTGITSHHLPPALGHPSASLGYSSFFRNLPEEMMNAKKSFTNQIKKMLHSLMISDLGYLLWTQGSETDAWINVQRMDESSAARLSQHPTSGIVLKDGHRGPMDAVDFCKFSPNSGNPGSAPAGHQKPDTRFADSLSLDKEISQIPIEANLSILPRKNGGVGYRKYSAFPYREAVKTLLDRLSFTPDPYIKLQILSELEFLVSNSMNDISKSSVTIGSDEAHSYFYQANGINVVKNSINVPRTKATSLEEVIANCTERRAGTLQLSMPRTDGKHISHATSPSPELSNSDSTINALLAIFQDPNLRPRTLYRDLQFIAAFVPPSILDHSPLGKAFWDTGLAALALKEDLCSSIIARATAITNYHISTNKHSYLSADPSLATTTLRDAARLWLITAKEGSSIAARELGLFYLTHPELLPRITAPLSKSGDVFRSIGSVDFQNHHPHSNSSISGGGGGGGGSGGGSGGISAFAGAGGGRGETWGSHGGLDPWTFDVVFHWMELAANGGDKDASDFLRGNGEFHRRR